MPNTSLREATAAECARFVSTEGDRLLREYHAHGIGVGRRKQHGRDTDEPAIVFYVERAVPRGSPGAIPATLTFTPPGAREPVQAWTEVEEEAAAHLQ